MSNSITNELLASFESIDNDLEVRKARRAVTKNGLVNSSIDELKVRENIDVFSINVPCGEITNQRHSGRCWMFAGLNVIRTILFDKLGVKNIELSQAYLQFYDKLEKANFFLTEAMKRLDTPLDDQEVIFLLNSAIGDGGHWAMFTNLVNKYGVVPSAAMPDNAVNSDTTELNTYLSKILDGDYKKLRSLKNNSKAELEDEKEKMLKEIYRVLVISLGVPPKSFEFEYEDKDGNYKKIGKTTPKEFFSKYVEEDLGDWIALANAPLEGYKPYTKYVAPLVNNVVGGEPVTFINVEIEEIKNALIASLKDKRVCWFAAEVSLDSLRKDGYLVKDIYNLDELTGIDTSSLNKGEKLDYRYAYCSHAMTFTGVNLDDNGKPNRYKLENTWGTENGKKGFYVMDDAWFNEYVYQVIVNSKYIKPEVLEKIKAAETVEVKPFNTLWNRID